MFDKIKDPYRFTAMVVLGSLILLTMSTSTYGRGWTGFMFWIIVALTQTTGVFLFLEDFKKVGKILLYSLAGVHALNFLITTIAMIVNLGSGYGFNGRYVYSFLVMSIIVAAFVFLFLLMIRQKD